MKTDSTLSATARPRRPAPRRRSTREATRPAATNRTAAPREAAASWLLALDSDGTVFDSMTPKHERCFAPAFAERFGEPADRELMAEVWRFVNLESRHRGVNRFKALAMALRLAARHPRASKRNRREEAVAAALEAWLAIESAPSRNRLELALAAKRVDRALGRVLEWTSAVDEAISGMAAPRPFHGALATLPLLAEAEIMVLTNAPAGAIVREWDEAGIGHYASVVCGQERGPKAASLAAAVEGRYARERVLVVGDAAGDLEAARAVGASFYPIVPGREDESWAAFRERCLPAFAAARGAGRPGRSPSASTAAPIAAFLTSLPLTPPWVSVTW